MRIGEAAAAAGLTPRALRYYEQEGLLGTGRTPSGHREYGPGELRRLRIVRELLDAGLTIGDVRAFAHVLDGRHLDDGTHPDGFGARSEPSDACPLAEVAQRRLADLDGRIERLTTLRARLSEAFDHRFSEQFAYPGQLERARRQAPDRASRQAPRQAPRQAARQAPSPRREAGRVPAAQATPRIRPTSTAPSSPTAAETR